MENILVVGGSDGLGLAIARRLEQNHDTRVFITGRSMKNLPEGSALHPLHLDIDHDIERLGVHIRRVLGHLEGSAVTTLVYSPGFNQIGTIDMLSDEDIATQINVTLTAFLIFTQLLLFRQKHLNLIVISSTSQLRPRHQEPVYAGAKAGLAHAARSIATEDVRIGKCLTALVSGMDTKLQRERGIDTSNLLKPTSVAESILRTFNEQKKRYAEYLFLRDPERVIERVLD